MNRISRLSLLILLAASCAEQRDPINRVQPDALQKSFFVGENYEDASDDPEFYSQGTLIRVGYGASQNGLFTSTYAQPVSRIKWVIQEDLLLGRLTYERIEGTDGFGVGQASDDGIIVVAYEIAKHFDIRRAYNPLTGEEMNIIEENDSDRPWYEREYIRVDWSKNLNTNSYDFDTLSQIGVYGGVKYESLAYYVNDPIHEDAPHFADDYFDITNKAFATPQMVDLSHLGWGIDEFPACFLPKDFNGGSEPVGNCNPVELTIRQSFHRVSDTDYEPAEWDGRRFQAYGAFTTDRMGYARNYGMSDQKWRRFISRYNIWQRSHHYSDPQNMTGAVACFTDETTPYGKDPHRDDDANGTEDECEAVGAGSRCDEFTQKCTLPYTMRQTRPIVWYYSKGNNTDYFDATDLAANQWDVALRSSVQTARYAECMRVEKHKETCLAKHPVYFGQQDENEDAVALVREVDDCRYGRAYGGRDCNALAQEIGNERGYDSAVIALAQMEEMVVLCHSPVTEGDSPKCGERGLIVRMGDLRYHQVNVIPTPQSPSPWGIYVDAHDPLTGETISASINVWSHVNDLWSQGVVDKIRYIKGELKAEQITEGENIKDWVRADTAASGGGVLPKISRAELKKRIASFANVSVEELSSLRGRLANNTELLDKVSQFNKELEAVRADAYAPSTMAAIYESRRKRAVGTELEASLNTRLMQELAGVDQLPLTDATMRLSSPMQGGHPGVRRNLSRLHELSLAHNHTCIRQEAPSPTSITGLAEILEAKFGDMSAGDAPDVQAERAERMRRFIADRAHFSVIVHEMGHSIGLRHNFVSSSDAWGYRPQYWQLRSKNANPALPECTDLTGDGNSCTGPRWFDPVSEEERTQLIWMFMHSSVMDYAGEYTQDMLGLGAYDFAAARMFYGDAVAVHEDASYSVGTDRGTAMLAKADNFGGIVGYRWSTNGDTATGGIHYSQLAKNFDLIKDCRVVVPEDYRPAAWDDSLHGAWHPVLDGRIVQVDGQWTRCKQQRVDYVKWDALRSPTDAEAGGFTRGNNGVDNQGRTRVPYGFGTDRWADLGNLAVYRHDNGADAYELFNFFVTEQEVNHIFDNYRRGRTTFSVRSASNRILTRYNEKMRDGAKGLGLFANIYRDFALEEGFDYQTLWPIIVGDDTLGYNALSTNVLASGLAFDHFTRMMARPEPGAHYADTKSVLRSNTDTAGNGGDTILRVPNGASGFWNDVGMGGKPVENALAEDKGEYNSEYTINAGSYYDKVYSTMLLTESVDNFISDSRRDFVDSRYRAVSLADLFPDGYRRWLANNLTGDDTLKGSWVKTNNSQPDVEPDSRYPNRPLGWTSWWASEPEACFPADRTAVCANPVTRDEFGALENATAMSIDPQVGWEQQKFLIAWTLMYLPENQQQWWLDMMNIWVLGEDTDPGFVNRIEFHDPSGHVYIAKTFGTESVFSKTVQKGVAARMLEYANELLNAAYVTDPGPDLNGDGDPDWYLPQLGGDGQPVVKWDPNVQSITRDGLINPSGRFGCNASTNWDCNCTDNRACVELSRYAAVPTFLRQAMRDYGLADPSMKGIY